MQYQNNFAQRGFSRSSSSSSSIICGLMIVLFAGTAIAQQDCRTPTLEAGVCVPYAKCRFVTQVIERYGSDLPKAFRDFIIRSRCQGATNEIHLCCENSFVEEGSQQPATPAAPTPTASTTTQRPLLNAKANYEQSLNATGVAVLMEQKCGISGDNRVAFGEVTNLAEFPWMALLRYDTPEQPFKCGGSLITDRIVLTAAHCMVGLRDNLIGVRLGEHDLSTERDCQNRGRKTICLPPVEDFGIEKTIPHTEYSSSEMKNDVALIKLDRAAAYQRHIRPICLPLTQNSTILEAEQQYFIAGWGTTETGATSTVLLKAKVPHKELSVCQNIYRRAKITENHICAGGDRRVDSCKGDSGGPLFFLPAVAQLPRYIQYGIVSFGGVACGSNTTFPGIYANVVNLMPWITDNIV